MTSLWERYGLVVKALTVAIILVALKAVLGSLGVEFISTLPLLTGLMGAVVFTLAILLAGVLSDFKESEKLVTELVAELERLDRDLFLAVRDEGALGRCRGHVATFVRVIHASLKGGTSIRMREVMPAVSALDAELDQVAAANGPPNYIIFLRQHIGAVMRMVYRLEGIVETTFVSSAYAIAGLVVAFALAVFAVTDITPRAQALVLYGFGSFLLVSLYFLIRDLDNPFAGHARVDLRPFERLEASLTAGPSTRLRSP